MTTGTLKEKQTLWEGLNHNKNKLPREILAEIIEESDISDFNIRQIDLSLKKYPTMKDLNQQA